MSHVTVETKQITHPSFPAIASEDVFEAYSVLAFNPVLDFRTRLAYVYTAARTAFEELRNINFRATDYRQVEHLMLRNPEDRLVAKEDVILGKDEVLEELTYGAESGEVEAMISLGDHLYHGLRNVEPNPGEAAVWFQRAADAGDERARLQLAKMHIMGQHVSTINV